MHCTRKLGAMAAILVLVASALAWAPSLETEGRSGAAIHAPGSRTTWACTNTAEFEAAVAGCADGDTINLAAANYTLTVNNMLTKRVIVHGNSPSEVIIYTTAGKGFSTQASLSLDNLTIIGGGRTAFSAYSGGVYLKVANCHIRAWGTSGTIYGITSAVLASMDNCTASIDGPGANCYTVRFNTTSWTNNSAIYTNGTTGTIKGHSSDNSVTKYLVNCYLRTVTTTANTYGAWHGSGTSWFINVTSVIEATTPGNAYNLGASQNVFCYNSTAVINCTGGGGSGPAIGIGSTNDYTGLEAVNCSTLLNTGTINTVGITSTGFLRVLQCNINITHTTGTAYGVRGGSAHVTWYQLYPVHVGDTSMNVSGTTNINCGVDAKAEANVWNSSINITATTGAITAVQSITVSDPVPVALTNCTITLAGAGTIIGAASLREFVSLSNVTFRASCNVSLVSATYGQPFISNGFFGNVNLSGSGPVSIIGRDWNATNIIVSNTQIISWWTNDTNWYMDAASSATIYANRTSHITSSIPLSWILGRNDYSTENSTDADLILVQASRVTSSALMRMNTSWLAAFTGNNYNASVTNSTGAQVSSRIDIQNSTISWTGPVENYTLYTDPRNPYTGPSYYCTNASVSPVYGSNTTVYEFFIGVANVSAASLQVNVSVDGVSHAMNDTGGGLYKWNSTFALGSHGFNISVTDGTNATTSQNQSFHVIPVNLPPVLSDSMVLPASGTDLDTFTFVTSAYDPEGHSIWVHLIIDDVHYPMTPLGLVYYYTTTFTAGSYSYAFSAGDSVTTTTSPAEILDVTASPVVLWGKVLQGTTAMPGITVEAFRQSTSEYLFTTTDIQGEYSLDCSAGWPALVDGEWITLTAADAFYSGSVEVQVDRVHDPGQHNIQVYALVPVYSITFIVTCQGTPADGAEITVTQPTGVDLAPVYTNEFGRVTCYLPQAAYTYLVQYSTYTVDSYFQANSDAAVLVALAPPATTPTEIPVWLLGLGLLLLVILLIVIAARLRSGSRRAK